MLVLLPPSETKAEGGDGPPLDLDALSFPTLTPVRRTLAESLVELAADVSASLTALALSERQEAEVRRNAELLTSPTLPALSRYTGVLYDALDVARLTSVQRGRAAHRLVVASALFGLVGGADPIPGYRLSGGSVLPGTGKLRELWRPRLEPVLAGVDGLVVDLRSDAYATLARVPDSVVVRVVTQDSAGRRKAVSHHNKAHKGLLARVLATTRGEPSTVTALARVARAGGLAVEPTGPRTLDLIAN